MQTAKGAATRRRIIEAASDVVRERGAESTSLDDVCLRSGTGKGQLFHYFPDGREELMLAVAELEAERVFEDQDPYLFELDSRATWEAWLDATVRQYREQGLLCPLAILISEVGRYNPEAQAVSARLVERWQEALRVAIERTQVTGDADPAVDAHALAAAVITAVQGGVAVLLSTGSTAHMEAALAVCLDRLLPARTALAAA